MSPVEWIPTGGIELEPNARAACCEMAENVAVIAGPGAGKTELLAQRADFLLRTNGCPYPRRILAISFKVDAARNLERRVRERCGTDLATRLDSHTFDAFALGLIRRFRLALPASDRPDAGFTVAEKGDGRAVVPFKALVPLSLLILDHPDVIRELRAAYSQVFLDEFQDCTTDQYQLVKRAFCGTPALVTAVGDTKQRIMGWVPGALDDAFDLFAADFEVPRPLHLYQNFRSEPVLRRMQNRMIAVMDPDAAQDPETLTGDKGSIDVRSFLSDDDEAFGVTDWVRERLEAGVVAEDIALLFPRQPNLYAAKVRSALEAAAIPIDPGDTVHSLRSEPLAHLIVDHLRLVTGTPAPDAYARLTGSELFRAETETESDRRRHEWSKLRRRVRDRSGEGAASLRNPSALITAVAEFTTLFPRETIASLHPAYTDSGCTEQVQFNLVAHLETLLSGPGDVAGLLQRFGSAEGVQIMTIHKSKGLEFDSVALMGVEQETYWADIADERALYFVGVSRAKENLLLTHASTRPEPEGAWKWVSDRSPHAEFLGYVRELSVSVS